MARTDGRSDTHTRTHTHTRTKKGDPPHPLILGIRAEVIFGSVRYVRYCAEFPLGNRYGIRYKEGLASSILDTMFGT